MTRGTVIATLVCAAGVAFGQATPPFQIRVQTTGTVLTIENGGTIGIAAAALRQTVTASVTLIHTGSSAVTVADRPRVIGPADFTVSSEAVFPQVLQSAQTLGFEIQFRPATSARLTGQISVPYTVSSSGTASSGAVVLNLVGTSPEPVFAWVSQPDGNSIALSPGGTIQFPPTLTGSGSTIPVVVSNRGTASLTIDTIAAAAATGQEFTAIGLPLLPATVEAGRELRVNVRFTPSQTGTSRAELSIGIGGRTTSFRLEGTGVAPQFTYELVRDQTPAGIEPLQRITFPDTRPESTSRVLVRFTNRGTAEGRVVAITATGTGFQVADPPPLPLVLQPGRSAEVGVVFSPARPGRLTGRLRIGDDFFELSGTALGPQLSYSYQIGSAATTVASGAVVIFPAIDVGTNAVTRFDVSNTGTASTVIGSIGLSSPSSVFSLQQLPQLPLTLNPGDQASFTVSFAPNALGAVTAVLRIDADSLTLSGISNGTVAMPLWRIEAGEPAQPSSQPAISLTLNGSYPLPLNGVLTIAGDSDAQLSDPAVQFASGGRTANFRVPANATQAVFAGGSQQIRMQTGTVAGVIRLTAAFTTESGLPLTPPDPPALRIEIAESPPNLLSVQTTTEDSSISVHLTGFATSRSVRQIEFEFAVAAGITPVETRFTINVEPSFAAWYQSAQSRPFGTQFTATVPFTFRQTGATAAGLTQPIQAVSVRLLNERGASETVTAQIGTR